MSVVRNRTVRNLGSLACLAVAGALLGLPSPAAADDFQVEDYCDHTRKFGYDAICLR